MPNSLRSKVKHLYHNRTINERERNRLLLGLDNTEAIEKIKAEIQKYQDPTKKDCQFDVALNLCLKIIDKHIREEE